MSMKNRRRGNDTETRNRDPRTSGRRKLLKSALLGGGAAASFYAARSAGPGPSSSRSACRPMPRPPSSSARDPGQVVVATSA